MRRGERTAMSEPDLSTFDIDGVIRIPYLDGKIIEARFDPKIGALIRDAANRGLTTPIKLMVSVTVLLPEES